MTKEEKEKYEDVNNLKKELEKLRGRKFRLDCGHHTTIGHHMASNITIYNGKQFRIICTLCSY